MDSPKPPEILYKYTCLAAVEDLCGTGNMRWGAPRAFNDPIDMQREIFVPFDSEELERALVEVWESIIYGDRPAPAFDPLGFFTKLKRAVINAAVPRESFREWAIESIRETYPKMLEGLRRETAYWIEFSNRSRVFCLTENQSHHAMWAHYGDNHKGVVVALRGVSELDSAWLAARPVAYVDELPGIFSAAQFAEWSASGTYSGAQMFNDQVYTKSTDWEYEREWRVIKLLDSDDGQSYWNNKTLPPEVAAIYFGCRVDSGERERLLNLLKEKLPDTMVYQARVSRRSYDLDFELLHEAG